MCNDIYLFVRVCALGDDGVAAASSAHPPSPTRGTERVKYTRELKTILKVVCKTTNSVSKYIRTYG